MTDATEGRAGAHGLTRVAEQFPGELEQAEAAAEALVRRMGRDVAMPDEPAHVYLLTARGDREAKR